MPDISFYHLHSSPLEKALPKLLEKVFSTGMRTIVLAASEEEAERLNNVLWTYTTTFFLPHGNKKDIYPERQPIYITSVNENPNGATLLLVTDGRALDFSEPFVQQFSRYLDMFDGTNEQTLAHARTRWSQYKKDNHQLTYWKQTAKGGWEKGA